MSQPGIRWKCYMHQHCAGFVLDVALDPFKSINAVSKFRKFFQISETRGLSAERDQSNHTESLELAATQTEHWPISSWDLECKSGCCVDLNASGHNGVPCDQTVLLNLRLYFIWWQHFYLKDRERIFTETRAFRWIAKRSFELTVIFWRSCCQKLWLKSDNPMRGIKKPYWRYCWSHDTWGKLYA